MQRSDRITVCSRSNLLDSYKSNFLKEHELSLLKWNCSQSDYPVPASMFQVLMLLANRPTEMGKVTTSVPVDLNKRLNPDLANKDEIINFAAPEDAVEEYDLLCYDDWKDQCQDDERDDLSETDWEEESAAWIARSGESAEYKYV